MSTATLNAPQVTQSRRNRGPSTPKSMDVPSNEAAVRTPPAIDYHAVVASIMLLKGKDGNGYGDRMVTNKGRQHVFTLSCNAIKSLLGMESKNEHGEPIRLPDEQANQVRTAISSILDQQWNRFKAYGGDLDSTDIKWTWDKAKHSIIPPEKSTVKDASGNPLRDLDLRWKSTAVTTRASKYIGEQILCAYSVKGAAEKRLHNMDLKPGEYTREQKREVMDLIHLASWKVGHLEHVKAHQQRQATAISDLDDKLSHGLLTQEQYSEQRIAVEAQPVPPM